MEDTLKIVNGEKYLNEITTEELLYNPLDRAFADDLDFMKKTLAKYRAKHSLTDESREDLQELLNYKRSKY